MALQLTPARASFCTSHPGFSISAQIRVLWHVFVTFSWVLPATNARVAPMTPLSVVFGPEDTSGISGTADPRGSWLP